jgi:hypothetical protein
MKRLVLACALVTVVVVIASRYSLSQARAPQPAAAAQGSAAGMSFFITSVGKGDGANLGGLAGGGCALPAAGDGCGQHRKDMARVSQRGRRRESARGERA